VWVASGWPGRCAVRWPEWPSWRGDPGASLPIVHARPPEHGMTQHRSVGRMGTTPTTSAHRGAQNESSGPRSRGTRGVHDLSAVTYLSTLALRCLTPEVVLRTRRAAGHAGSARPCEAPWVRDGHRWTHPVIRRRSDGALGIGGHRPHAPPSSLARSRLTPVGSPAVVRLAGHPKPRHGVEGRPPMAFSDELAEQATLPASAARLRWWRRNPGKQGCRGAE
jgi:hypothetical protein